MRLLLDTHTFLWFINDSSRLSARAKAPLESDADLFLSIASLWEMAIKTGIGKLALPKPYDIFIPEQLAFNEIEILPISISQLKVVSSLPQHHLSSYPS